jgi:hypothetical protein
MTTDPNASTMAYINLFPFGNPSSFKGYVLFSTQVCGFKSIETLASLGISR